ncbi:hypothetical protein DFH07DRAFT_697061, partial [Mycena maculata]
TPPAKRQRTDASITRSDVWYKDGSVVLQADATQFRVHWGVLAQHSSFFRDMEGLPQPPGQDNVDGCLVVELAGDSAVDVQQVLKTLYNPSILFNNEKAIPFPIIASIVRLGRKYDFEDLLRAAVERLTFENPSSLEHYDALRVKDKVVPPRILDYSGLCFDVITLARENHLSSILPCAYYRVITSYDRATLFDGIPRRDGTSATLLPIDQRRCVLGRERLLKAQFEVGNTAGWFQLQEIASLDVACTNVANCNKLRATNLRKHLLAQELIALRIVETKGWTGLCAACKEDAALSMNRGRRKVWEELPGFFDLPSWAELKNDEL